MKLITSITLLLLALLLTAVFALPTFLVQLIRYIALKRLELDEYFYKLAVSLDYLGATLIFGTTGRTISSLVYQKNISISIKIIDFIFYDGHCKDAYQHEKGQNGN